MRSLVKDARSPLVSMSSTRLREAGKIHNVESEASSTSTESILVSMSQTSPELGQQEISSSNSSDTTLVQISSTPGTLVGPRKVQSCGEICRCRCHIKVTDKWPHLLQRSAASNVIGFMSRPSFSYRCSDHACKGRQAIRAGTVYVTPSWLRKRAIFISVLLRGWKIERHIRGHNIVAPSSDVARYALKGDTDGLRRLFSQRHASVYDCTPDGWSLLHVSRPMAVLSSSREIT